MSCETIVPNRLCLAQLKVGVIQERRLLELILRDSLCGPHGIKSLIAAIIFGKAHLEAK